MINWAEMVRQRDIEVKPPLLTDQQVKDNLRGKIDLSLKLASLPAEHRIYTYPPLFSFTADRFSYLKDENNKIVGKVGSKQLEKVGLTIMKEYGLDEEKHRGTGQTDDELHTRDETCTWMSRTYDSGTVEDLTFNRKIKSVTATGKILSVEWTILGMAPESKSIK